MPGYKSCQGICSGCGNFAMLLDTLCPSCHDIEQDRHSPQDMSIPATHPVYNNVHTNTIIADNTLKNATKSLDDKVEAAEDPTVKIQVRGGTAEIPVSKLDALYTQSK